jgi:RimJ/RimL family protein N-acetyltransferase
LADPVAGVVTMEPLVLRGPTVTLRALSMADAEALAGAASESREQYVYTRVPDGVADAQRYIELALADRDAGHRKPFAIVWHDRVVGSTSYLDVQRWRWPAGSPHQRSDRPDAVEIGSTWLAASAQRTRCNTEAKHLLLSHAFDVWGVYRVALKTDERNATSRRAIERLGAVFEGVRRADMPAQDGSVRSSAYYSIVRAEWPNVRTKLEEALAGGVR